ncbi:hypothetical protein [Neobacillus sp. DY30]|uniref:hypothetical protein n=1 Tax=Neobacillus sp. DY30 TaxID=3047871 RepID=UPI0024BF5AA1|nr:hypothetical protein [Neobacillus sp. DY30]WHX99298.1 hypothetical protein QNH29_22305 [Neobacillus sp. DY30]
MENKDVAVAQIVSAIIAKPDVYVGADTKNGVYVHIKKSDEMLKDYRSTLKLEDLVKIVKDAL